MPFVTVKEIQKQRKALRTQSISEGIRLLKQVGFYFENIVPSDVKNQYVLETEKYLNDLYRRVVNDSASLNAVGPILDALDLASELSRAIKEETQGRGYHRTLKELGRTLILISENLMQ